MGVKKISASSVSPKLVKSNERREREINKKQAGFVEPHSSLTIGWFGGWGWVGLG